jgi:hypothetical protein
MKKEFFAKYYYRNGVVYKIEYGINSNFKGEDFQRINDDLYLELYENSQDLEDALNLEIENKKHGMPTVNADGNFIIRMDIKKIA